MAEKKEMLAEEAKEVKPLGQEPENTLVPGEVADEERGLFESGLKVVKEGYISKKKKSGFLYQIVGEVRGKKMTVSLAPPDKGGYALLDALFGEKTELPLLMVPYEMTDESGVTRSGFTYVVQNADEDGVMIECKLKPRNDSDKRLLEVYLQKAKLGLLR